jgi:hypothetical protein
MNRTPAERRLDAMREAQQREAALQRAEAEPKPKTKRRRRTAKPKR